MAAPALAEREAQTRPTLQLVDGSGSTTPPSPPSGDEFHGDHRREHQGLALWQKVVLITGAAASVASAFAPFLANVAR